MPTEPQLRAFLLGMSDPATEQTIEEGILDATIATDDLWVIEEELIDDHVFGRLSADEERAFQANFLNTQERNDKLGFSRALHKRALEHASASRARQPFSFGLNSRFAMASAIALFGLLTAATGWLGIRDARLNRELAEASRASDERQRLLAAMMEEQKQRTASVAAPAQSTVAVVPAMPPGIELRPGVRRGLEAVPVLHIAGQAAVVRITLELAFEPQGGVHEELLRGGGAPIWSQELPSAGPLVAHRTMALYLPAALLTPGDYQIRVKDLSAGPADEGDVYAFRVSRP